MSPVPRPRVAPAPRHVAPAPRQVAPAPRHATRIVHAPGRRRASAAIAALGAAAALLGACAGPPVSNTPAPATGVFEQMAANGITTESLTAGDAGCADPAQAPFAIHATIRYPLSAPTTTDLYLFTYADHGAWLREASSFDTCRRTYADSAAHGRSVEELDVSPYRAFGPAWSAQLRAAIDRALTEAAGNGGQ